MAPPSLPPMTMVRTPGVLNLFKNCTPYKNRIENVSPEYDTFGHQARPLTLMLQSYKQYVA